MKRLIIIIISLILGILIIWFTASKIINIENNILIGTIQDKTITIEKQSLKIKDNDNNILEVRISNQTLFKQQLNLENGDILKIKGNYLDNNIFDALEIESYNKSSIFNIFKK